MDHHEAEKLLLGFQAGELDRKTWNEVDSHIGECVDCRAWLETYDLLADSLGRLAAGRHPDSETLARSVVEGDEGELAVREHLESCAECREEIDLVRDAVLAARTEAVIPASASVSDRRYSWWHLAAAACVMAVALKIFVPVASWNSGPDLPILEKASTASDRGLDLGSRFPGVTISDEEISGTRIIEADGSLTISEVKILDGANVTIRAGDVVAFGNGFQIGPKAQVSVGGSTDGADSSRDKTDPRSERGG